MPDSLRTLKDQAFEGCENLQSIILADSLTGEIGNRAFYNCKSLTTITIPDKVESIGQYVFSCRNVLV